MDEHALIQGMLEGDRQAFNNLVSLYQDKVYNTVFTFVQNEDDALDLCQDVFIEVYQSIRHFRKESSLATWIYRIAVNKALNLQQRKSRKGFIGSLQQTFGTGQKNKPHEPADSSKQPHEKLENKELVTYLRKAISSLPKNQRIAFVLHKYEDLPYKEISKIMNISLPSVESLIFRARKGLQRELLKYFRH